MKPKPLNVHGHDVGSSLRGSGYVLESHFFLLFSYVIIISFPFFPLFFVELESHGEKEKKEEIHYAYVNGVVYNVHSFILP
jgi:hypothetical protein